MSKTWPGKRGRTSRKAKEISSSKIILASSSRETILQQRQGSSLSASSWAVSTFADSLRGRDFLMGTKLILRERLENRVRKAGLPFAPMQSGARRLLLCQAMNGAESPDQINGMDSNYRACGEQIAENAESYTVPRIVECGHQHGRIRNVEVRVAGGEAHALEKERRRHGQLNDIYFGSVFQPCPSQALPIFFERAVVLLVRVFLTAKDDRASIHKAAQIIDVTVRIVSCDSFPEPYNVFHAEVSSQRRFGLRTIEPRISALAFLIEKALFGGKQRAGTIHVEASAFENHITLAEMGAEDLHFQPARGLCWNCIILLPVRIARPGVEAEPSDGNFRAGL